MVEERCFDKDSVYEGDFVNGVPHGKGKYRSEEFNNRYVYEGDFVNDEQTGKGKKTYEGGTGKWRKMRGSVYEGDFVKGEPHGIGKMTYANGWVEEGKWKDGEFLGK